MANSKIRVVLVSHGEQSKGMLNTVQMLLGEQDNIAAYSLYPEQSVSELSAILEKEIESYGAENIIFLSELKHGSPFNTLVMLTKNYDLYHVTGVNLAMLMTVLLERDFEGATCEGLCESAVNAAKDSYADVRKMLMETDEEED